MNNKESQIADVAKIQQKEEFSIGKEVVTVTTRIKDLKEGDIIRYANNDTQRVINNIDGNIYVYDYTYNKTLFHKMLSRHNNDYIVVERVK